MVYNPPEEVCRSRLVDIVPIVPPDDTTYTLTVIVNPVGAGTVTVTPEKDVYDAGERVTVTALVNTEAEERYEFTQWSGSLISFNTSMGFPMSKDIVLTANFIIKIGSFTDTRDGQIYKTIVIDNQTWMAENLNYKTSNSWFYENKASNCATYGRLYNSNAAMSACPVGWRLPTNDEWGGLRRVAYGIDTTIMSETERIASAAMMMLDDLRRLKSESWNNGTNSVGFSALPGGARLRFSNGWKFRGLDSGGSWWITGRDDGWNHQDIGTVVIFDGATGNMLYQTDADASRSVRCVQD
jgi:uncharacterized protein (TIGR02145 family)